MGKKEKILPCIAIKDGKQCDNPAHHGITTEGVTRICYCDFHWERLQVNNSINLSLEKVKTIKKKDKKNYKVIKNDVKGIRTASQCIGDYHDKHLDKPECAVKIVCPKKDEKCTDGYYRSALDATPRTPAYKARTPGRPGSPTFVPGPGSPGPLKFDPRVPGGVVPSKPDGTHRSPVSSVKSKTSKKSKDESESESESESDANDSSTDSDSGSDVSDSDSEAESSSDSEAEVKTKLRVPGYGGKNKKIINYKSIKKSKGVKPNPRDIRGRYEVMRSDIAPYIKIDKRMVSNLKDLDTTYDMDDALKAIRDIKALISSEPKNKEIAKRKEGDQDMWSVEESVINYIAEKLAPYVNDSDRLELLLSYIFDFDRRDLTKKFSFYGFSKPKDKIDTTPYMHLKFLRESETNNKVKPIPADAYPQPWAKPIVEKAHAIQGTFNSFKIQGIDFGDTAKTPPPGKNPPVPETCSNKNLKDIIQITNALIIDDCFASLAPILTSTIPDKGRGKGDGLTLDNIPKKLNELLKSLFSNKNGYEVYIDFNLEFKPEEPYQAYTNLKDDATDINEFMKALYERLGKFYNECKNAIKGSDTISSRSVSNFTEYIANIFSNKKVPLDILQRLFGRTPKGEDSGDKKDGKSTAKPTSGDLNAEIAQRRKDYASKLGSINGKIKEALFYNTKIQLDTDEKTNFFKDNLISVKNDEVKNVENSIKNFGKGKFNKFDNLKKYIIAGKSSGFTTEWDGN
jgi:hypothetical protein